MPISTGPIICVTRSIRMNDEPHTKQQKQNVRCATAGKGVREINSKRRQQTNKLASEHRLPRRLAPQPFGSAAQLPATTTKDELQDTRFGPRILAIRGRAGQGKSTTI